MGEVATASEGIIAKITPGLEHLAFPIADLVLMPGNPNEGDVEYVARMYDTFGQTKPTICKMLESGKGLVLAGNTGVKGARDILGWTHVAVNWVNDWDDAQAAAYTIGDNESARRSHENLEYKAAMLEDIAETDPNYLEVVDFDLADIQEMMERVQQEERSFEISGDDIILEEDDDEGAPEPAPEPKVAQRAIISYTIQFDNEDQQQHWFAFLRWLKTNYDSDTLGGRLDEYLDSLDMG